MQLKDVAFEVIAIAATMVGGLWAVGKSLLHMRDTLDERIDKLERESITREEFNRSLREIRDEMHADMQRIDNKLEAMNGNIMLLVHTIADKKDK